jgi:hypothetical protein
VLPRDEEKVGDLSRYEGKTVAVTGLIGLSPEKKPQIAVTAAGQIVLVEEAASAPMPAASAAPREKERVVPTVMLYLRDGARPQQVPVFGEIVLRESAVRLLERIEPGGAVKSEEGDDMLLRFPDGGALRLEKYARILKEEPPKKP